MSNLDKTLGNFDPDPTIIVMREYLYALYGDDEQSVTLMEVDEAIYWFAHDYHGGNFNLLQAMKASRFQPNAYSTGMEDTDVLEMYCQLMEKFT